MEADLLLRLQRAALLLGALSLDHGQPLLLLHRAQLPRTGPYNNIISLKRASR